MSSSRGLVTRIAVVVAILGVGCGVARSVSAYDQTLGITIAGYLIIAVGWNLSAGYGGQVSLGVSAFAGVGSYSLALLIEHTGVDWALAIVASGLAAVVLALVVSVPLLRLRGDYFTVGTLAVALALQTLAENWQWTGGSSGILLPLGDVPDGPTLLRAALIVTAVVAIVALIVGDSRFGLRLLALRDNEKAAEGLGVPAFRHRLAVLVIAASMWGVGGAVVTLQNATASPSGSFDFGLTLSAVLFVVVGGTATFMGPVIGVFVVYYGLTESLTSYQTLASVIEGALLVVIVRFAPLGIWPFAVRLARAALAGLAKKPTTPAAPSVTTQKAVVRSGG